MNGPIPSETFYNYVQRHVSVDIFFEERTSFLFACYQTSQLFTLGHALMEACVGSPNSGVRTYSYLSILIGQPTAETFLNSSLGAFKFVEIIKLPYSQAISTIVIKGAFRHYWNRGVV